MDFDFEDTCNSLRHLRRLAGAYHDKERFFSQLGRYSDAGWPFGRETGAFLLWAQFEQETTVN